MPEIPLNPRLNKNIDILKSAYKDCSDVVFRDFSIGSEINAVLLYIDGLSNTEEVDQHVLMPLIQLKSPKQSPIFERAKKEISVSDIKEIYTITGYFQTDFHWQPNHFN